MIFSTAFSVCLMRLARRIVPRSARPRESVFIARVVVLPAVIPWCLCSRRIILCRVKPSLGDEILGLKLVKGFGRDKFRAYL